MRTKKSKNSDLAPREIEPPASRSQVEPGNEKRDVRKVTFDNSLHSFPCHWNQTDQQLRVRIKVNNQLILNAAAGRLVQMGVAKIAGVGSNQGRARCLDIRVPLAEEGNQEIRSCPLTQPMPKDMISPAHLHSGPGA
ncbi:hypothetical protein [Microseira wollei]|uniref:Uncharacterized protein n=1 Tax=Microseira wollei NIES-4236 TaxID=2530354 RepID=A0AAV3XFH2_9CYAN|nr:hypothetical protein [Microseira wollei]GET41702.1 hypothetical protein MiSe_65160 [Microseira wollei NIES-4236]